MEKINLRNDYSAIAHKEIIDAIVDYSNKTFVGYGLDDVSREAQEIIKKKLKNENVDIHFMTGGTISNKVVISHVLKPYEAVISADTGHINVHETGTIEQSGHKVLTVPNINGKIKADDVLTVVNTHTDEHMVKPKMVYISNPTEFGTVYKKEEIENLYKVCKENDLYLYIDGARLACALTSDCSDLLLTDLPNICDAFYIGGTKNGLMLGEAIVIMNEEMKKEFRYSIKHFGGMYSKGFVNGIQFKTLFSNDLFYRIGKSQNEKAKLLYNELVSLGVKFIMPQETNQIFPVFKNELIEKLKEKFLFEIWEVREEETVIRFVTSFMTSDEDIKNSVCIIKGLL